MIVKVEIYGIVHELDLSPVKYLSDLKSGDEVVTTHPVTKLLCRAGVESRAINYVTFKEISQDIASHRWSIGKIKLRETVYKINK